MLMPGKAIMSVAYLPNIQYFSKILSYPEIIIDIHETYSKQSYRNRAEILGANGILNLIIPVKKPYGNRTKTCDIQLDYDTPWMQVHWKAIISAYRNSPFFEYFEPELRPYYWKKEKYLADWNLGLTEALLLMTGTEKELKLSHGYIKNPGESEADFRDLIHPKKKDRIDAEFSPIPYFQVFSDRYGSFPNLSFIDLMFNEGPQAAYICKQMYKKKLPQKSNQDV